MTEIPFPGHRYVPGRSARHPEDWFDHLKQDDTTALRAGLAYFDAGYFWECHEVLEAVWLRCAHPSDERDLVQAIIQLANARLKLVMDRPKAAARLCDIVETLLAGLSADAVPMGLDVSQWWRHLHETRAML